MEFPKIIKESIKHKKIEVMDKTDSLAVYDHECKNCGHNKAELIEISANYADEDHIIKYKCGKCGFTETEDTKSK
jgi:DNA-directed RNA polymerase subunit M/transcription elongation factor TFIIS